MKENSKILLKDVKKSFGTKKVLKGINLDILPGESVVIIGGSGSGKSVLLKCILGLIEPDEGVIKVDNENTVKVKQNEREHINQKFGMLFQGAALFDSLTVWENVAFGLIQFERIKRSIAKEQAINTLKKVGLSDEVAHLSPAELSGGMQKRVGLARAIASSPEILFFDEPTTGLDPIMADVINDLIISIVKNQGITALSITHDMSSARKISDRIAMIYDGKLIWTGEANQIDHSENQYVDQFINGRAKGPIKMELRR